MAASSEAGVLERPAIKEKKAKSASAPKPMASLGSWTGGPAHPTAMGRRTLGGGGGGVAAAARFLQRNGYTILERNWTCFAGEADIIAINDEALVFVEVKTRRNADKGLPSEAVTRAKREKYERIALAYIQDHFFGEAVVRFDVVAIIVLSDDRAFIRHHLGAYSAG